MYSTKKTSILNGLNLKLVPFDFDWSNYDNDERSVLTQMRKAIKFYVDMGVLSASHFCKIDHRSTKRAGAYSPRRKVIKIASWLFRSNSAQEVESTIKHEIAHAIDIDNFGIQYSGGKRDLHGRTWKAIARAIGDDGERCYDSNTVNNDTAFKYTLRTNCCGMEIGRSKMTERVRRGFERGSRTFSCCNAPRSERTVTIIDNY